MAGIGPKSHADSWFQIMARRSVNPWQPIESYGFTIKFPDQEEAEAYKRHWLARKGGSWEAFVYAVEE